MAELPLRFLALMLKLLPESALAWLWSAIEFLPGKIGVALRYSLLLRLAQRVGRNVYIGKYVKIAGWKDLCIGDNVSMHRNCYIDAKGGLEIGNDVSIAHSCSILTFEHDWEDRSLPIKYNKILYKGVVVEDDVWIGCGSRILAGVTIKKRTIVAAGSVVTKGTLGHCIVAGVPARNIKDI
ncbi:MULTISPECIES: acyltransferase [unclassified Halomonas]|uniref:acyltransferase n=1 Tax=unclassified Halomonas TaxID=2609666 RepID=UPI001C97E471|nr:MULTISPECIES: acyltransferase [unclassified Halomonas]MBY5925423.1 acyltransferase [Halomonas sp. DP4Y7-2]MBY6232759.1 acyltransferase [Halomonas sp. DP4Y7-1]